jgi:hypothetical protein
MSALRTRYGPAWPKKEFWKDKIKPYRKIVSDFIRPVLTDALAKQAANLNKTDTKVSLEDSNDETLLAHLVGHTQGLFR